jgi:monovalent cation:H+ antiporter-2, CPA2 family
VFSGEGEVALALTVALLRDLGATPDQIDRERDRVRGELLGRGAGPAEPAPAGPAGSAAAPPVIGTSPAGSG